VNKEHLHKTLVTQIL